MQGHVMPNPLPYPPPDPPPDRPSDHQSSMSELASLPAWAAQPAAPTLPAALSRREFVRGTVALAGTVAFGGYATRLDGAMRTTTAGAPWPRPEAWEELRRAVGDRLIRPESPLKACHLDASSGACKLALEQMTNPFFVQDHAGAAQSTGWLDAWEFEVSPYAVAATSADDIAAAVNFAREHGVRLAVRGAGHDYLGRNTAPDSLLVWTHAMRDVTVHDDFVPVGAPAGTAGTRAVSVSAGTRWLEAYEAATAADLYVQGGGCTSVGASGGFILGSGFGSYSKRFGTGAGGVLEFEIVTADGTIRIVNQYQDPDLFWALRGGGGGTFGIVARTTLLAHPIPHTTGTVSGTIAADSDEAFRELIRRFVAFYPDALNNPRWGEQIRFHSDNHIELAMVFLDITGAEAEAVWQPLLDELRRDEHDRFKVDVSFREIPFKRVWDQTWWEQHDKGFAVADPRPNQPKNQYWWAGNEGEVGAFWTSYHSRWVPLAMFTRNPEQLAAMFFEMSRVRNFIFQINKGLAGQSDEAQRRDRQTCLHPTAFDAAGLIILASAQQHAYPGVAGHEPDLSAGRKSRDIAERAMAICRRALPGQGSYANEANYFTEDWKDAFWGDHYPRLLAIKRRIDPTNLFRVHHGVGSD